MFFLLSRFRFTPLARTLALVACVGVVAYLARDVVYATTDPNVGNVKGALGGVMSSFRDFAEPLGQTIGKFLAFGSVIVAFIGMFFAISLGNLMDSTYVLGSGMGETLHLMWAVVRNIVNIGFIAVLLGIAVMVILDVGGDKGGMALLKKALPKLIIALVAVNFTFFGARVVLSTADVIATAVFAIPSSVPTVTDARLPLLCGDPESATYTGVASGQQLDKCRQYIGQMMDQSNLFATNGAGASDDLMARVKNSVEKMMAGQIRTGKDGKPVVADWPITVLQEGFDKKNGAFAILLHVLSMTKALSLAADGNASGQNLFISGVFSFFITIAIAIMIFAMALAMIVRAAVLWVTIGVSPVIALMSIMGEAFGVKGDGGDLGDPMKLFFEHAFLPTMAAIPMSLGFVMILSGHALDLTDISNQGMKLDLTLGHTNALNTIIWWVASVLVMWMGVFGALGKSKFVSKVTEKVKAGAEGFFGGVTGMLKYAPIIPTFGEKQTSMAEVLEFTNTPRLMEQKMHTYHNSQADELATKTMRGFGLEKYLGSQANPNQMRGDMTKTAQTIAAAKDTAAKNAELQRYLENAGRQYSAKSANELNGDDFRTFRDSLASSGVITGAATRAESLGSLIKELEHHAEPVVAQTAKTATQQMEANDAKGAGASSSAIAATREKAAKQTGVSTTDTSTQPLEKAKYGDQKTATGIKIGEEQVFKITVNGETKYALVNQNDGKATIVMTPQDITDAISGLNAGNLKDQLGKWSADNGVKALFEDGQKKKDGALPIAVEKALKAGVAAADQQAIADAYSKITGRTLADDFELKTEGEKMTGTKK